MHPAYSVILFTTASGAGYGLLAWLTLFALLGIIPPDRWLGVTAFGLGLGLVTLGLLSSTFHLGRPERAWRAYSQWRSSWLSREGVLATATYAPVGLFAIGWIFFGTVTGIWAIAGLVSLVLIAATVICTAMIYASLKTIRQWHQPLVPLIYLLMALATGGAFLLFLLSAFGYSAQMASWFTVGAFIAAGIVKFLYWRRIDTEPKTYTAGQATGLGRYGTVRPFESAHSRPNFVMREMGYQVARKHARKLRLIVMLLGFALPILAALLMLAAPTALQPLLALAGLLSAAAGVAVERWLFFAEAQHVVTLYYGAQTA